MQGRFPTATTSARQGPIVRRSVAVHTVHPRAGEYTTAGQPAHESHTSGELRSPWESRTAGQATRTVAPARQSVFGEVLVLREVTEPRGPGVSIARAEDVTRAFRGALLRFATDPPPAVLSGHEADGRPLDRPHTAFLALPAAETARSSSSVCGVAIVLPREIAEEDRQAILLAAARWESSGARLVLGRLGEMRLARTDDARGDTDGLRPGLVQAIDAGEDGPMTSPTLAGPSRRWASLTPIALHRNPGNLAARDPATAARAANDAEKAIADACGHIGLPRPIHVRVARQSRFAGIPAAPGFMPYPRHGSGFKRVCVHAELEFREPVRGPVVLGVGRYFGVGLCGATGEWTDRDDVHRQPNWGHGQ